MGSECQLGGHWVVIEITGFDGVFSGNAIHLSQMFHCSHIKIFKKENTGDIHLRLQE